MAEKMANEAYIEDKFKDAIELYSQAIDLKPTQPGLYANRAQAYLKLFKFPEALADANRAIELDPCMAKAYLRKGTACLKLGEYRIAKTAFQAGYALDPQDLRFTKFIDECEYEISDINSQGSNSASESVPMLCVAKTRIRHEYHQKPEELVITFFATGIPAESVSVDYGEQNLSVTIDIPGQLPYRFKSRLFGKIIPAKCRYEVLSTKIEIYLAKADLTCRWSYLKYLDFSKNVSDVQKINVSASGRRSPYQWPKRRIDWDNRFESRV